MVEIQGENGTALTGKQFTDADSAGTLENVGVINNLGHSLWEQIVLFINDTNVTESSNNSAYKAMLETFSGVNMSAALKYINCPVSQLDLLEPIGVQTQVNSFKDIEYLPTSAIQDGTPVTFEIGKYELYTDASEFVTKTVVEIQGENGTALTGKQFTDADSAGTLEKVGVINNLGHSLWEQIVLFINDTKVTESSNNSAYKAMLGTLLSYDDVDEKSVLRLSCFKKDHGNVTADCPTATHANSGLVACSRYFEGGKRLTLITRPRTDLCQQPRYIPDQCKILLKLTPNKSSFVLMSDKNDAKYRLKIHSCTLMV